MRVSRLILLIVLSTLLLAYLAIGAIGTFGPPSAGASTPTQLVLRDRPDARVRGVRYGPEGLVGCLRYCLFDRTGPSAVVLYTLPQDEPQAEPTYNYALAGYAWGEWHTSIGGGGGGGDPSLPAPAILFRSSSLPQTEPGARFGVRRGGYLLLLGRAISPEVTHVEATFDTGQTLRDAVTDGMFGMLVRARATCDVRALDSRGRVVWRVGPSEDLMLATQIEHDAPGACSR